MNLKQNQFLRIEIIINFLNKDKEISEIKNNYQNYKNIYLKKNITNQSRSIEYPVKNNMESQAFEEFKTSTPKSKKSEDYINEKYYRSYSYNGRNNSSAKKNKKISETNHNLTYQNNTYEKKNKKINEKIIDRNNKSNKSNNSFVDFIQNFSNKNDLDFKIQLNEELLKKEKDINNLQNKNKELIEQIEI